MVIARSTTGGALATSPIAGARHSRIVPYLQTFRYAKPGILHIVLAVSPAVPATLVAIFLSAASLVSN